MSIDPVKWESGKLAILDQRQLPQKEEWIVAEEWEQVAEAIRSMAVRGAPLIGIAAAYGLALAHFKGKDMVIARAGLAATRPTAVNLFHALDRVFAAEDPLEEAHALLQEEADANDRIAANGASLLSENATVMTICNTGGLATVGVGTALGVIRKAHALGKLKEAVLLETRPRQQGMKLSAWELQRDGIPFRVIADGAAAWFMKTHGADMAIAGADRIARNGDTANKIGTYGLALLARAHDVRFVVAAPTSTVDPRIESGREIPIEEREPAELTHVGSEQIAPRDCPVWNPAFDVTPAALIDAIVTDAGIHSPPFDFGVLARSHS